MALPISAFIGYWFEHPDMSWYWKYIQKKTETRKKYRIWIAQ